MSAPTTDSWMYQTMFRQPADLRRLLAEGWDAAGHAAELLTSAKRVFLTGIGTSYHASLMGGWLLRAAGLDARAVLSSDFALYPDSFPLREGDAVIVMAHTGVKTTSALALARAVEAGATVLSIGSLTAEHPGSRLVLRTVEREKSAAYTASHLAAQFVLAQVATVLGERSDAAGTRGFRQALERLPELVEEVLGRAAEIEPIARLAVARRVYATGAGPNEVAAIEAVIKVREAAHGWIDALALEQFLHGPMVATNAGDLVIVIDVPGAAARRTGEVAAVAAAMGADVWLVGQADERVPGATVFALPGLNALPEVLTPLLSVVPMQLLAYQMAVLKGLNPDTFRRDDPIYRDAFGLLKL